MATRSSSTQSLHDKVIAERESAWRSDSRVNQIYTNPGQTKGANYTVDGREVYPDLIVHLKDDKGERWIIEEVETADSVNESELEQWRTFAQIEVAAFNLLVPQESAGRARSLVQNLDMVAIRTYSATGTSITFNEN